MNNHMYMAPAANYLQVEHTPQYGGQDSRLWGGFGWGWGRPWGWGFGSPFFGFGAPFGFGFGYPFFGGFPFFI
jgi:hypothetical protein